MTTTADLVKDLAANLTPLVDALVDADTVQWQAAPVLRPRADTTERASGGHGDPTPAIALDEARLKVRAAYVAAEQAVEEASQAFRAATADLRRATDAWRGQ